jgi:biotin-(acetyl-CoA carboxylase) ligase
MTLPEPAGDDGRPIRRYQAAVSAGAMASAWANQEDAPSGATVVVDHEVSPLGRLGLRWLVPAESSLAFAVVLRPSLTAEESDVPWLVGGLAAAEGIGDVVTGRELATWWPDLVVGADTDETVASVKADVHLGPGRVRVALVTVRINLEILDATERRDELVQAVARRLDQRNEELTEGVAGPLAAYEQRCRLLGSKVKIRLLPRGETRGTAHAIHPHGALQLRSATGMVERISVDMVREMQVM